MSANAESSSTTTTQKIGLRGAALSLLRNRKNLECLIVGPSGTGKTFSVILKAVMLAAEFPDSRILFVRKTRASMTQSILVILENDILPHCYPISAYGQARHVRSSYRLPNGSEIVLCGLDNVERIMSAQYDLICVFEATEITENDWEMLLTRLRNNKMPFHQAIADCNPAWPGHWLNRRAEKGKILRLESHFGDNPSITREYIESLSNLTGHRRERLYLGRWAAAEGLVYPDFDDCFIDPMEELPDGAFRGGVDFGFHDPFAAVGGIYYIDESGNDILYIFYERYKSKCGIAVHAAAMKAVSSGPWYADPSRPDLISDLRRADLIVRPARNSILAGIDAVSARIASGRLLVSTDCRALKSEAQSYSYPADGLGEKPLAGVEHALDALRYLILGIDSRTLAIKRETA